MNLDDPNGAEVDEYAISSDSATVVFIAFHLYSVPIDHSTGATRINGAITGEGWVRSFLISPDGTTVVYYSDQDEFAEFELFSVPIGGGTVTQLNDPLPLAGDIWPGYQITPDNSTVVYRGSQDAGAVIELYSVPIGGGTVTKLNGATPVPGGGVLFFAVTSDGSTVVYSADQDVNDRFELYSAAIDGSGSVKLSGEMPEDGDAIPFIVTPDGSRAIFYADKEIDNRRELYSVPVGGGVPVKLNVPLQAGEEVFDFVVSPDSSTVVYRIGVEATFGFFELHAVPVGGGTVTSLAFGPDVDESFSVTADSSTVLFVASPDPPAPSELYSVPLGGGAVTKLNGLLGSGGDVSVYLASASGSTVVYSADAQIDTVFEVFSSPVSADGIDRDADGFGAVCDCNEEHANCTTDCADDDDDGLQACEGDCDDTNSNCTTDCTDGDGDGFCVTHDCDDVLPECTINCDDSDGDGLICDDCDDENANCTTDCADPDGDGFCVTHDCDESNPHCTDVCTDGDGDGYCTSNDCDDAEFDCRVDCSDPDSDGVCGDLDCDSANAHCTTDCTDADGDGYCVLEDCDEGDPLCTDVCTDGDGDGYCTTNDCDDTEFDCRVDCSDPDGDGACGDIDCDSSNPGCTIDCTDRDGDGYCIFDDCDESNPFCTDVCTDGDGDGYCTTNDCNDADPQCSENCFDLDDDGACAEIDCDEFNSNCTTDCTDADGDGFCVTHDCDDAVPACTTDCSDGDGDGLRACDGDCDDTNGNCTTDCTDGDGDGFCVLQDCDDGTFACNVSCVDADGDGVRVCDGDCNDGNPFCTVDCTDTDGDGVCIPQDCHDGDVDCALDCTDDDGDGLWACQGDCDDENPNALPGLPEICTDFADNDCNGLTDTEEPFCAELETSNLRIAQSSPATLTWDAAANADAYGVYRGRIPRTGFAGYNHICEATLLTGNSAVDPDIPRRGEGFYYLVTGLTVQSELVGGPLGTASSGVSRPDSDAITCGPRVYVDPDNLAGATDGLSWPTAYTSLSDAVRHGQYDNRGSEIWVRAGEIDGGASASVADRPAARILGGFDGTESDSWERPAAGPQSVVDGRGFGSALGISGMSVAVERMTFRNAGSGVLARPSGTLLELIDVSTEQISGYGVDIEANGPSLPRLNIEDGTFDATSGLGGVRAVCEAGTLSGLVLGNTVAGGSDAALRFEALPDGTDATVALDVVGNTISGGNTGIVLGAQLGPAPQDLVAMQESFVASNLIHGTSGPAVIVEAGGTSLETGDSVISRPLIVGNTFSDGGDAGVLCSALRTGPDGQVRSEPEVWDNLITFHAGAGIEETADDPAAGLAADPLVVGNDLFGNLVLYRDEGTTDLTLIGDVNALPGAFDNYDADPLYVDRPGGDFHLQAGSSPALDAGHLEAPRIAAEDIDGEPRVEDGDGDGSSLPDSGADERQ